MGGDGSRNRGETRDALGSPESGGPRAAEDLADRKAATHERILRAAVDLFAARGFKETSVAAIATRAGVSRAAVFWHFGDKASLFHEVCKQLLVPFRDALEVSLQHLDPRKRLFELFAVYEHFVAENRETIEAFVHWTLGAPALRPSLQGELLALHAAFTRDVQAALAELLTHPEEASVLAAGLVSLLDGNLVLRLFDPAPALDARRQLGLKAVVERVLADRSER